MLEYFSKELKVGLLKSIKTALSHLYHSLHILQFYNFSTGASGIHDFEPKPSNDRHARQFKGRLFFPKTMTMVVLTLIIVFQKVEHRTSLSLFLFWCNTTSMEYLRKQHQRRKPNYLCIVTVSARCFSRGTCNNPQMRFLM